MFNRIPLYATFLIISLVIGGITGVWAYWDRLDTLLESLQETEQSRLQRRMVELQGTVNDFITLDDLSSVRRELLRLSSDPQLEILLVIDENNRVAYSTQLQYQGVDISAVSELDLVTVLQGLQDEYAGGTFLEGDGDAVLSVYPLKPLASAENPFETGRALLVGLFDLSLVKAHTRYEHEKQFVATITIYCISFFAAAFLIYIQIKPRMNRIISASHEMSTGNYTYRVNMRGGDEFADIARAFDSMAAEIEQQHNHLQKVAHFDSLTDLLNRKTFIDRAAQLINSRPDIEFTVIFIDLDGFKVVNDALGHPAGDRMLCMVADRIARILKEGDLIGRFGGDEFLVLLQDVIDEPTVEVIIQRILEKTEEPIQLDGFQFSTTASIGVARFPADGENLDELVMRADIAMYQAKDAGKNTWVFYDSQLDARHVDRLRLQGVISGAIENDLLEIHYQPQFDAVTNAIVGCEALLRIKGEDGLISPALFIPVAEEGGLMPRLGMAMIRKAMREFKDYREHHPCGDVRLAVNVSYYELRLKNFAEQFVAVLKDEGVDGSAVELEITEGSLVVDIERTAETLGYLRSIGVSVAIDDFGTGYSSLSYLQRLPINKLKIDRSFINDIGLDVEDESIVETIIAIGNKLGMQVVAEGVENESQRDYLISKGCTVMQGFLFARPAPIAAFIDRVAQDS